MSQITTHVLDTARGYPAADLSVELSVFAQGEWQTLARGATDADGRCANLLASTTALDAGTYRLRFITGAYLQRTGQPQFYPWVDVVFDLAVGGEHYHVPLLLSPYAYSTYRGS